MEMNKPRIKIKKPSGSGNNGTVSDAEIGDQETGVNEE